MQQHKWTCYLLIFLLSVLITACGGGSSNDNEQNDNGSGEETADDSDNTSTPSQVNGELTGYIYFADDSTYLDLSSGKEFIIDIDDVDHLAFPSSDGMEYATTANEYRDMFYSSNDAIIIKSMLDGRIQSMFEISSTIYGAARLSPDRQIIAARWRDESSGEEYDSHRLTLFSRDGQVLSRSPEQDISSFDWLSNGHLVYTTDNAIYMTAQPGSTNNSTLIKTFDDTMGKPIEISASHDGTKLSFELYTDACPLYVYCREGTVWIMNIDGSDLHLLATTDDEEPMVNSTVWSPDGKWVATVEGYFGGMVEVYDPIQPGGEWHWEALDGVPGVLYAVPSTSESVTLPGNGSSGVLPVAETTSEGLLRPLRAGYSPEMKWLSSIPIATEERGSLPENAAALSGTIYFDDDGEGNTTAMHAVNLQDATDQILFKLTDDDLDNVNDLVYSSHDGQLFSHYCNDYSNSYNDDRRFIIFNRNGQILANILGQGNGYEMSVRRAMRFSPVDSNLLLILYSDYYSGSDTFADYLVTVLDWNRRTFLKHFNSQEYNAVDWTADGDILLAGDDGNVYLANVTDQSISDPVLYISGQDNIKSIAVSPDGNSIAYTLNEQIWVSDINGDNFQRLTGFTSGYNMFPEWSPDGRYIAFKHMEYDNHSPIDYGKLWVVAADAKNIQIRETSNTTNAIPVMSGDRHLGVFGSFSWR